MNGILKLRMPNPTLQRTPGTVFRLVVMACVVHVFFGPWSLILRR